MRGEEARQSAMFSYLSPEQRVPNDHPLRSVKKMADEVLERLSPVFSRMYSKTGRPSVAPERLLKSMLLMAFYSIRSERLLCEQLQYNLLYRWFLDMAMDERVLDHSTFSQNRERLMAHAVGRKFFEAIVKEASKAGLTSDEHFTVDGTLIEAWASLKSFRPKNEGPGDRPEPDDPGNPTVDFHGEKRTNETYESTTDPEARLMRKSAGKEAKLSYGAHVLMENRNGLLVDLALTEANGKSERDAAGKMLGKKKRKLPETAHPTVGADKGYDTKGFVDKMRGLGITPHVASNTERRGGSAIDGRTTRHAGYGISQKIRKRVEEIFGWMKSYGGFRKTRFKGLHRTRLTAYLVGAAYNLIRLSRLIPAPA